MTPSQIESIRAIATQAMWLSAFGLLMVPIIWLVWTWTHRKPKPPLVTVRAANYVSLWDRLRAIKVPPALKLAGSVSILVALVNLSGIKAPDVLVCLFFSGPLWVSLLLGLIMSISGSEGRSPNSGDDWLNDDEDDPIYKQALFEYKMSVNPWMKEKPNKDVVMMWIMSRDRYRK